MVLIIGLGGTGSSVAMFLARRGINIAAFDFDKVNESDLNRQILYGPKDVGKYKVEVAEEKLSSFCKFKGVKERFDVGFESYIDEEDIIIDCSDNMETRKLLARLCHLKGKRLFHTAAIRNQGRFAHVYKSDFYSVIKNKDVFVECHRHVEPSVCGIIGALCANEVILTLKGKPAFEDKMLLYEEGRVDIVSLVPKS